jgi:geranylgeranyl pyrophosphate synthase
LDIFKQYKPELDLVEAEISKHLTSNQSDLKEICEYLLQLKGKRFRPLMVILTYKLMGGSKLNEIIPLATALEFIHTATLIHDDINDKSSIRRGHETVSSKYGNSRALILGDYIFALGFKLGGSYGKEIVELVAELSSKLAEGEFNHLRNLRNHQLSEQAYFDIIESKTSGPLIGGAKIGAIIGHGASDDIEHLGSYGRNVGIAFQIIDDILDITSTTSQIGKPVSADLKSGKITLPTIYALQELRGEKLDRFIEIIESENASDIDMQEAVEIINSTEAIPRARAKADSYVEDAIESISNYESSKIYESLIGLARYTVERTF